MDQKLDGGVVFTASEVAAIEYLPNNGVFLGQMLGKSRGDTYGLIKARVDPGCGIAREIHPDSTETIYVLSGEAVGFIGDREIPLLPGQVMHVEKNVHHGIRNAGTGPLEFLVIASPDF